mmetsp:Transcript_11256/g.29998  ORF Transcript_11256/g.29998 Transcript_11256/m.29998 type:complete len:255 (-) Transcript_11256:702-1466(-)
MRIWFLELGCLSRPPGTARAKRASAPSTALVPKWTSRFEQVYLWTVGMRSWPLKLGGLLRPPGAARAIRPPTAAKERATARTWSYPLELGSLSRLPGPARAKAPPTAAQTRAARPLACSPWRRASARPCSDEPLQPRARIGPGARLQPQTQTLVHSPASTAPWAARRRRRVPQRALQKPATGRRPSPTTRATWAPWRSAPSTGRWRAASRAPAACRSSRASRCRSPAAPWGRARRTSGPGWCGWCTALRSTTRR